MPNLIEYGWVFPDESGSLVFQDVSTVLTSTPHTDWLYSQVPHRPDLGLEAQYPALFQAIGGERSLRLATLMRDYGWLKVGNGCAPAEGGARVVSYCPVGAAWQNAILARYAAAGFVLDAFP